MTTLTQFSVPAEPNFTAENIESTEPEELIAIANEWDQTADGQFQKSKRMAKQAKLDALNDPNSKEAVITEIAQSLCDRIKIIDGNPFIKKNGVWTHDTIAVSNLLYQKHPNLSKNQNAEIIHKVVVIKGESEEIETNTNLIYFRNGVYDLEKNKFRKETDADVIFNKFDCDYDPKAPDECEIVDRFMNHLSGNKDEEERMIWEMIAYSLSPANPMQRAHLLIGAGGTGKSVLLKLIMSLIGKRNTKAVDLQGLNQERTIASLYGKHLCVVDEAPDYVPDITGFKTVTSGGLMNARFLYAEEFDFQYEGKLIMSTNEVPRMFDTNDAIMRRLIIIPCTNNIIPEDQRVFYLEKELYQYQTYFVKKAMKVLIELLSARKFTRSDESMRLSKEGVVTNNPVVEFFDGLSASQLEGRVTLDLYKNYVKWANERGFKTLSDTSFGKELRRVFSFDTSHKRIDGNRVRLYVKVERLRGTDPDEDEQLSLEEDCPF